VRGDIREAKLPIATIVQAVLAGADFASVLSSVWNTVALYSPICSKTSLTNASFSRLTTLVDVCIHQRGW